MLPAINCSKSHPICCLSHIPPAGPTDKRQLFVLTISSTPQQQQRHSNSHLHFYWPSGLTLLSFSAWHFNIFYTIATAIHSPFSFLHAISLFSHLFAIISYVLLVCVLFVIVYCNSNRNIYLLQVSMSRCQVSKWFDLMCHHRVAVGSFCVCLWKIKEKENCRDCPQFILRYFIFFDYWQKYNTISKALCTVFVQPKRLCNIEICCIMCLVIKIFQHWITTRWVQILFAIFCN